MHKAIKIFVIVVVFLGVLSSVFLLFAKKKPQTKNVSQSSQVSKQKPVSLQDQKKLMRSQWQQCKDGIMPKSANFSWNIQVLEGVAVGGSYAKGNLDGDNKYPVWVFVKSDSLNVDKIKSVLVAGKTPNLRGTCAGVSEDGEVILQAF
ncbi:MAG: hypothetical protein ACD_9C00229G0001 [uncultured bacterium]|nr:MAG: hypothetical protein ACD_9C00229G0001 [uncultured bacterium]